MPPIHKQPRQVNKDYLIFLRSQPCSVCRKILHMVPHHTITRGAFGSDYFSIPLCTLDHHDAHTITMEELQRDMAPGIPLQLEKHPTIMAEIIKNLIGYIEHLKNQEEQ